MSDEKETMKNPHCKTCQYRRCESDYACDYMCYSLDHWPWKKSHRRGCSIADCERWRETPVKTMKVVNKTHDRPKGEEQKKAFMLEVERKRAEREAEMLRLYTEGKTDREISQLTNRAESTVMTWRKSKHLPMVQAQRQKRPEEFTEEERQMRHRLAMQKQNAKKQGVSLSDYLSKINREQADREIIEAAFAHEYAAGLTDTEIAMRCGTYREKVRDWRHRTGRPAQSKR